MSAADRPREGRRRTWVVTCGVAAVLTGAAWTASWTDGAPETVWLHFGRSHFSGHDRDQVWLLLGCADAPAGEPVPSVHEAPRWMPFEGECLLEKPGRAPDRGPPDFSVSSEGTFDRLLAAVGMGRGTSTVWYDRTGRVEVVDDRSWREYRLRD